MLSEDPANSRNTMERMRAFNDTLIHHLQKGGVNCAWKATNGFRKTPADPFYTRKPWTPEKTLQEFYFGQRYDLNC